MITEVMCLISLSRLCLSSWANVLLPNTIFLYISEEFLLKRSKPTKGKVIHLNNLPQDLADRDPMKHFEVWFEQARTHSMILEPNAVALATANSHGQPSVRTVLLKHYDKQGFKFFTNLTSQKAAEMDENPLAALLFYWEPLHRQVRVEGTVSHLSAAEADQYFRKRPKPSQVSASVSRQSSVVASRQELIDEYEQMLRDYADREVPRPKNWGGFLVHPAVIEFWQGSTNRLHDRLRFRRVSKTDNSTKNSSDSTTQSELIDCDSGLWLLERLAP